LTDGLTAVFVKVAIAIEKTFGIFQLRAEDMVSIAIFLFSRLILPSNYKSDNKKLFQKFFFQIQFM